jgi:hypothetical protein
VGESQAGGKGIIEGKRQKAKTSRECGIGNREFLELLAKVLGPPSKP